MSKAELVTWAIARVPCAPRVSPVSVSVPFGLLSLASTLMLTAVFSAVSAVSAVATGGDGRDIKYPRLDEMKHAYLADSSQLCRVKAEFSPCVQIDVSG